MLPCFISLLVRDGNVPVHYKLLDIHYSYIHNNIIMILTTLDLGP